MWQRVQTVYLVLAVILPALCCMMPLAVFVPREMGFPGVMYSLALIDGNGAVAALSPVILFALAVLSEIALLFALFSFKNRRRQMRLCTTAACLQILWIAAYIALAVTLRGDSIFRIKPAAFFPLAAVALTLLARKMIKKDDELVKSVDRLR